MNDINLNLFIRIVDHLEFLTTYDEYGSSRSKGLTTRADLAEELNEIGIVPKKGFWTTHSLECFLSRMQKQYGYQHLRAMCDIRFLNSQNWEIQSGTHHTEVMQPRLPASQWDYGKITACEERAGRTFRTTSNDLWKSHEALEMWLDEKMKKILNQQNILRRNRAFVT